MDGVRHDGWHRGCADLHGEMIIDHLAPTGRGEHGLASPGSDVLRSIVSAGAAVLVAELRLACPLR